MCGIIAVIGKTACLHESRIAGLLSHRGPDGQGKYIDDYGMLHHDRLAIVDLETGKQPIGHGTTQLIHNGEIYNHQELRDGVLKDCLFKTQSDSEVILHLYKKFRADTVAAQLDGIFSFVILDGENILVARDPIGVKPLYYGQDKAGNQIFASEIKAVMELCDTFKEFPAGHYFTKENGLKSYFKIQPFIDYSEHTQSEQHFTTLRNLLTQAVEKRLMADVPIGCLLSGGLDSSLIAAITSRLQSTGNFHTFSVGISPDAPDLKAARLVASYIGSQHHEIVFSMEDAWNDMEHIIWHLESYDLTNVRSGIPLYYLCKTIAQEGIKVVLSGEGADEMFGGYLFFNDAPSDLAFQQELINKLNGLATIDCLRVDRMSMAHGVEVRVPFLDLNLLKWVMALPPGTKRPSNNPEKIEKYQLRKAFYDQETPYLPESVLWRQKEQFSDGVGYEWSEKLTERCNTSISDHEMANARKDYAIAPPETKEALWIRRIFERLFPSEYASESVTLWQPAWQNTTNPSARNSRYHIKSVAKAA